MKVKYSVIPFVPAFLAMMFFKLMSLVGADGSGRFMGMDNTAVTYTVLGITLGLFAVCIIINLFDRKTAPVYPVKKNAVAGIFAVLAGLTVMAYSITTAVDAWQAGANQEYKLLTTICAAFSLPAGISLALMSRIHFAGKSVVSSISMLYVFPSLWGCAELVNEFMQATKTSVSAKDLTRVICYIFIALFFFSSSMVVSRIKGRNPVKGVFIYGLPMAAISLTFGIYELIALSQKSGVITSDLTQNLVISSGAVESSDLLNYSIALNAVMLIACAAYALVFIFELFLNTYTKDDIEIISGLPNEEDTADESDPDDDELEDDDFTVLYGTRKDDAALESDTNYASDADSDYAFASAVPADKKSALKANMQADFGADPATVNEEFEYLVFSDAPVGNNSKDKSDDDYFATKAGLDDYIMGFQYNDSDEIMIPRPAKKKSVKKQDKAENKAVKKTEPVTKPAEKAVKPAKVEKAEPKAEAPKAQIPFGTKKAEKAARAERAAQAKKAEKPVNEKKPVIETKKEEPAKVIKHPVDAELSENLKHGSLDVSAPAEPRVSNVNTNLALELKKAAEMRKNPAAQQEISSNDALARQEVKRAEEEKARRTEEARKAEEARRAEQARRQAAARRAEEEAKAAESAADVQDLSDVDRLLKELEDKK